MKEKIINLLGIRKKVILSRSEIVKGKKIYVVIEPITEEQEKEIDNLSRYTKDNDIIGKDNIYVYGEIDINNKEDVNLIAKFNLVDFEGNWIYSNFDYDKGTYTTVERKPKLNNIINPELWFKYCYCLIGKPKRIIIYRCSNLI